MEGRPKITSALKLELLMKSCLKRLKLRTRFAQTTQFFNAFFWLDFKQKFSIRLMLFQAFLP